MRMFWAGILPGRRLRQSNERVLGRDIGTGISPTDRAENGRHVDDRASARFQHRGDLIFQPVEDAVEVDVDDFLPVLERIVAGGLSWPADAGVVHC